MHCDTCTKTKSAIAIVVHGYGAHGCYPTVRIGAERLVTDPTSIVGVCYALDFAGFGKSDGLRGYIPSLDSLVQDVQQLVKLAREEQQEREEKYSW